MNIVVPVKQVPDTNSERRIRESDGILDRDGSDAVLDEIDERAVEAALQLKDAHGGSVTVVTMGPDRATESIRKALAMGADSAVHLSDQALAGSDAVQTARALASTISTAVGAQGGGVDLVLAGNEASDGRSAAVPAMIGEVLGLPVLTHAREITIDDASIVVKRETDDGVTTLAAPLPAVVSVGEKINEPRYPSFKGIMAAKKKKITSLDLAGAGLDPAQVGAANAGTVVVSTTPGPAKSAGEKIVDAGDGGSRIAAFLVSQKLI